MDNISVTQLYSKEGKDKTEIYPKSYAEFIDASKDGTETTVQDWLEDLTTSIGQITKNAKWAYNSIPVFKYKVTNTVDVPSVTENSDDYSTVEGWKDQITEDFTGYLWMINATVVNDVYQLNGSKVWSSPTLISVVK